MAIKVVYDATANDSNKSWTVPAGKTWKIHWMHVIYVSTATVGNRLVKWRILDENNNEILDCIPANLQAANGTIHYMYGEGTYRDTTVFNGAIHVPVPFNVILLPGYTIQFYDANAIDAAADDMTVSFQYNEKVLN